LERQEIGVRAVRGELRVECLVPRRVIVDQDAAGRGVDLDPLDARHRGERLLDLLEHAGLAFRPGHLDAHPAGNVVADMGLMRHDRHSSGLACLGPPDPGDRRVTQGVRLQVLRDERSRASNRTACLQALRTKGKAMAGVVLGARLVCHRSDPMALRSVEAIRSLPADIINEDTGMTQSRNLPHGWT
jgi:hypothetical protein